MKLMEQNSAQKLRGGYYTPKALTDYIIDWAFEDGKKQTILEPSCGDGAFLESLIKKIKSTDSKCIAIELESDEAEKSKMLTKDCTNINVRNTDFFKAFHGELINLEFDLIVGNPPYIRYQYLTPEQRDVQSQILIRNGMKSNKLINAWVSFVVACVQLLKSNGKIGLVIPAELLQVAYAEDLRQFLSNTLAKITVITFKELVFPDVQQEVVVLLGEKTETNSLDENKISIIEVQNLDDLNDNLLNTPLEYKEVDHNSDKWTKYFLTNNEINVIKEIKNNSNFVSFEDVAQIDIGITTGNNKYFSVNKDTVEKYDLSSVALPLIGRSAHATGIYFNQEDWLENVDKGLLAQLINFPDEPYENFTEKQQEYIKWGEQTEQNIGYKLGIRKHWYRIPSVYSPDAFFLRRNDNFPKFVLNEIGAVSTDTMHRLRFKEGLNKNKILLSYYNSISLAFTEIEGRSYGGGVLEILPGEVEKIMLPNLQNLDEATTTDLLEKINQAVRNKSDIEPILDEVDQKVLVEYLNINKKTIDMFRDIWRKLMSRRRKRK
ncbi:N-6 DNA methylase [Paenibacillaceae bacterium WGS1546]|uniref:N-6 DNA methylase n=1 Tax=Cohnella sp. WGS1546 TaxID=3366810 RepID=UPI00372D035B